MYLWILWYFFKLTVCQDRCCNTYVPNGKWCLTKNCTSVDNSESYKLCTGISVKTGGKDCGRTNLYGSKVLNSRIVTYKANLITWIRFIDEKIGISEYTTLEQSQGYSWDIRRWCDIVQELCTSRTSGQRGIPPETHSEMSAMRTFSILAWMSTSLRPRSPQIFLR